VSMPTWDIHRLHAEKFLREIGLECARCDFIDRLVDEPDSTIPLVLEEIRRSSKLLALMLSDRAVRPEDPVAVHDWGAWRGSRASVDALRRVAEAVAGRVGPLLVDLHLSLDYVWKHGLGGYPAWAEELGIAREVREYIAREFSKLSSASGAIGREPAGQGLDRARGAG